MFTLCTSDYSYPFNFFSFQSSISRTLRSRRDFPVSKSYTNRLLNDAGLLKAKIREEAEELIEAGDVKDPEQVAAEAADLLYFTSVLCVREGVSLNDIEKWLNARSLRVRRRPGNAKPKFLEQSN